jgi:hypothetical protein
LTPFLAPENMKTVAAIPATKRRSIPTSAQRRPLVLSKYWNQDFAPPS